MGGTPFTRDGWLSKSTLHVNFSQPTALRRKADPIIDIKFLDHGCGDLFRFRFH